MKRSGGSRVARAPGLYDRVIAITRSEQEAREFSLLVKAEGGTAVAVPAIEIVPAGPISGHEFIALLSEKKHDYCAFMSAQAVRVLFSLADVRAALMPTGVIAVGPRTKQELEEHGVSVDMMPDTYSSVGLAEMLAGKNPKGKKIIIPRSGEANEFAAKALSDLGMEVDEVLLYTVRTGSLTPAWQEFQKMLAAGIVDAVVFTSASNVRAFFELMARMEASLEDVQAISIGPFTSAELEKRGVKYREAQEHTIEGTVKAAKELFFKSSR
jgi:uroporphyrinogen-III synthase